MCLKLYIRYNNFQIVSKLFRGGVKDLGSINLFSL